MKALLIVAALASAFLSFQAPAAAQNGASPKGKAKAKAGPVKRFADGKPNMTGYWQTKVFFTAFDLEAHATATFEVPAGPGVVVDPPNGKIPYQPWALEKKKDIVAHHLADDPQAHCSLSGVPRQLYTPFGFQILHPKGAVLLNFEAFHAFRILHLGGKHPDQSIKLFQGDSRAHWEGDTLVVDVANLNDRTWFDMEGNFHSDELHVVERYTPKDADTIHYEATLTDPKVYTQPWKIAFDFGRNLEEGYETLEYACVEGEQDLQHYTESVGGAARDNK
ncbi:MAG: hypothetical protein ABIR70_07550 [Bryobacteraceae bacterium]